MPAALASISDEAVANLGKQVANLGPPIDGVPRFVFRERWDAHDRLIRRDDIIGGGAYGMVARCFDRKYKRHVAVKRIDWTVASRQCPRIIRELQVIRHFRHPNLVHLLATYALDAQRGDAGKPSPTSVTPFNVYLVCELMDVPLSQVIRDHMEAWMVSGGTRGQYVVDHVKWMTYQLLHGLHAMHSAGVVHRDIKPHNLLVRKANSELKICDFGLSRASSSNRHVSHYVVTRYYRAPEIIYGQTTLDPAIDIWASGCVAAELVTGEPLFALESSMVQGQYDGAKASQQLLRLLNRLGKPGEADIAAVPHKNVRSFLAKIETRHLERQQLTRDVAEYIRSRCRVSQAPADGAEVADPRQIDCVVQCIDSMLAFNPSKRPSASQLMQHEAFTDYHEPSTVQVCPKFTHSDPSEAEAGPAQLALLRDLASQPVPECDADWSDEEEDAFSPQRPADRPYPGHDPEQAAIHAEIRAVEPATAEFMRMASAGHAPPPELWGRVMTGRFGPALAAALQNIGVTPALAGECSSEQLQQLARWMEMILVPQMTAARQNLVDVAEEFFASIAQLLSVAVTAANVVQVAPLVAEQSAQIRPSNPDLAAAILGHLEVLRKAARKPDGAAHSLGAGGHVNWGGPEQDPADADMELDWTESGALFDDAMDRDAAPTAATG
eukprot:TRINITY_DN32045_c0_g1_i1.p1 TRINITY_DN32045_c0_g1~~TRINITY_DN32045_c0_g1_i1.p1  ORF type:complete len:699 (+),score=192.11 TRINITY_DN32045_c0_g1_i1:99-2099(+)